ncbi:hypothetical protein HPG69_003416 [Diceros bicornis minor]|uniref:glucuronosyltransferase n=1 Tax=Diceros bicornis minor TaxID=77932 RepID=A0A7J7E8Y7_DICBM|nr:hypothetical protein HPG69_003416 [Diceros bicornis minor]
MDQMSHILQDHGHNVTMFLQSTNLLMSDFKEEEKSYQVITWLPPEESNKEHMKFYYFFMKENLLGRHTFENLLKLMELLGLQCNHLLRRNDIMDSLKNENFDLIFVDAFDFCSLLVAEKLGKRFVVDLELPSPLPVSRSLLTNHMDFRDRMKNVLMFFYLSTKQRQMQSAFDNTIKEHFPEGSRPVLSHLLKKEFENFIDKFGDSGFVLVALGSMVSSYSSQELLKEMNSAFAHLPQEVIWRYKASHWPKDIKLAANVKIVDWLPQSDLLSKDYAGRLLSSYLHVFGLLRALTSSWAIPSFSPSHLFLCHPWWDK